MRTYVTEVDEFRLRTNNPHGSKKQIISLLDQNCGSVDLAIAYARSKKLKIKSEVTSK
jgi:hypothetical protein